MIFDNKKRNDLGYRLPTESHYKYLDRSSRKIAIEIREVLENWLSNYPREHANHIVKLLRSNVDHQFIDGFFELYLFNLFLNLGANSTIHPKIPETRKTPDFLVNFNGNEFYLEAVAIHLSKEEATHYKSIDELTQKINEGLVGSCFTLAFETDGKIDNKINYRQIICEISSWLKQLDRTMVLKMPIEEIFHHELTTKSLKYKNCVMKFVAIPLEENHYILEGEPVIGMGPCCAYSYDTSYIKKKIQKKFSYYGKFDKPFVVAVNIVESWKTDDYTLFTALFGQEQFKFSLNSNLTKVERKKDGLWINHYTRVSAILATGGLTPSEMNKRDIHLILNPNAANPLSLNPLHKLSIFDENRVETKGISAYQVLNLPKEWSE